MSQREKLPGLSGQVALITGGGRGAGSAIARQFALAGADVAITYRSGGAEAEQAADALRALGVRAEAFPLDQSRTEETGPLIERVAARFGRLDCLVNNAGVYPAKPVAEVTEGDWDAMLDCNTRGVFFLSRAAAEYMGAHGGGAVVNISSINAVNPAGNLVPYGVSKAAVEMVTRCLAQQYGPAGVRVNCVAPGLIWAEGQEKTIPGWRESYCARAPLGRLVQGEDVGNACLFLCSSLSAAVTGQTLTVDCGVLLAPCFDNG